MRRRNRMGWGMQLLTYPLWLAGTMLAGLFLFWPLFLGGTYRPGIGFGWMFDGPDWRWIIQGAWLAGLFEVQHETRKRHR